MKTLKNKVFAILVLAFGCLPLIFDAWVFGSGDGIDATYMVFLAIICVPMFFSRESWFYENDD